MSPNAEAKPGRHPNSCVNQSPKAISRQIPFYLHPDDEMTRKKTAEARRTERVGHYSKNQYAAAYVVLSLPAALAQPWLTPPAVSTRYTELAPTAPAVAVR